MNHAGHDIFFGNVTDFQNHKTRVIFGQSKKMWEQQHFFPLQRGLFLDGEYRPDTCRKQIIFPSLIKKHNFKNKSEVLIITMNAGIMHTNTYVSMIDKDFASFDNSSDNKLLRP